MPTPARKGTAAGRSSMFGVRRSTRPLAAAGLENIRKAGRPRKAADICKLVLDVARDNPGWGYTRIRDALRGLKIEIGRTTVANMLTQAGIERAPERNRKRTWKQFLKSHWETLYACDFFGVEVRGVFGTVRHMVFVIEVKSRADRRGPHRSGRG
jgi:hypothetical protein